MIAVPVAVPPPVALAAAPARLVLRASTRAVIRVANTGGAPLDVRVTRAGLTLGREGLPAIAARPAPASWLTVSSTRFRIRAHTTTALAVRAGSLRSVRPGDHSTLLLLSAARPGSHRIAVALRVGVVVVLRAPGTVRQRLALGAARVAQRGRRTIMRIEVVNGGDLDEWIGAGRVHVTLRRAGRVVARPRIVPRRLLARTRGVLVASIRSREHGRYVLEVRLARPRPGRLDARRRYRIVL